MSSLSEFFQSTPVIALLIAILIFIITIFLVVKRWISFSVTFLFLLFSLTAGLLINHQQTVQHYFNSSSLTANSLTSEDSQDAFHKQMLQAVEDLKAEMKTEKENLQGVMSQIQEIFETMDAQKQKLQNFIEETREHFKTNYPIEQTKSPSAEHSDQPASSPTNSHKSDESSSETKIKSLPSS